MKTKTKMIAVMVIASLAIAMTACSEGAEKQAPAQSGETTKFEQSEQTTQSGEATPPPQVTEKAESKPKETAKVTETTKEQKSENDYIQLDLEKFARKGSELTRQYNAQEVFIGMGKSLTTDEIIEKYGFIHSGSGFDEMDSNYISMFGTRKYRIDIYTESDYMVKPDSQVSVNSWEYINDSWTMHYIEFEEMYSLRAASKFEFLGTYWFGTFEGATVDDFYNDPMVKRIMEYPENYQFVGVSENKDRSCLKKDGVEIKEGKLETGMTFERIERTSTLNDGRIIYHDDDVIFGIIELKDFNY